MPEPRKPGLHFKVVQYKMYDRLEWAWKLVGAEGTVAVSPINFPSEEACRSHIAANRGRLKASARAKVITEKE